MLPVRGRPKKGRLSKRMTTCSYGLCCKRNTEDIKKVSFLKPCSVFYTPEVLQNEKGHVKNCEQCKKCLHWIHLCKRIDRRFQNVSDIRNDTFICAVHFCGSNGPTAESPDPIPANSVQASKMQFSSRKRNLLSDTLQIQGVQKVPKANSEGPMLKGTCFTAVCNQPPDAKSDETYDDLGIIEDLQSPCHVTDVANVEMLSASPAGGINSIQVQQDINTLAVNLINRSYAVEMLNGILNVYTTSNATIPTTCRIDGNLNVISMNVYNKEINKDHALWNSFPRKLDSINSALQHLEVFYRDWTVCKSVINDDLVAEFKNDCEQYSCYYDTRAFTIRSKTCDLLTQVKRCTDCKHAQRKMYMKLWRRNANRKKGYQRIPISRLTIMQARQVIRNGVYDKYLLQKKNARLMRKIKSQIHSRGVNLQTSDNQDLIYTMIN